METVPARSAGCSGVQICQRRAAAPARLGAGGGGGVFWVGAAAKPFEDAADGEIDAELTDIHGDRARGLETIQDDVRADAVGALDDGAGVYDERTAEKDEGNGDEESGVVNGGEEFFERQADAVLAGDGFDAGAVAALLVVEVLDGWKFEIGHHDFVARASEIEARGDDGLGERDVLVERQFPGRGADEGGDLVADARGHLPPAFFPSADAARVPEVGIIAQPVIDSAGHGAEGIADQIGGALEDGEFLAPVEKIIHSAGSLPAHTCRRGAIASGMMPPVASV